MYSIEKVIELLVSAGDRLSVINDHKVRGEIQSLIKNLSRADLVPVFQAVSEKRASIQKFAFIYQDLCVGLGHHLRAEKVIFGPFKSPKPNIPDGVWDFGIGKFKLEVKSTLVLSENSLKSDLLVVPQTEISRKPQLAKMLTAHGALLTSDITLCRLTMIYPDYFKHRISEGWTHSGLTEMAGLLAKFQEFSDKQF